MEWVKEKLAEWIDISMAIENRDKQHTFKLTKEEEKEAFKLAKEGDEDAKSLLWLAKKNAIDFVFRKAFNNRPSARLVDEAEYTSKCVEPFLKSLEKFDESKDVSYNTYLFTLYKNAINNVCCHYEQNNRVQSLNEVSLDNSLNDEEESQYNLYDFISTKYIQDDVEREAKKEMATKYFSLLPSKAMLIFKMNIIDEMSIAEIARNYGVKRQAIMQYVSKARNYLQNVRKYSYEVAKLRNLGMTYREIAKNLNLKLSHVDYYYNTYLYLEDMLNECPIKPVGIWNPDKAITGLKIKDKEIAYSGEGINGKEF